jgi:hypothetical protein
MHKERRQFFCLFQRVRVQANNIVHSGDASNRISSRDAGSTILGKVTSGRLSPSSSATTSGLS